MIKYKNISIINLLSLCYFFIPLIIYHKSYIATIVLINGIFFHTNRNIYYLFLYDTISNIILVSYKNYYNPNINYLTSIGSIIFILNTILYRKYNLNKYISDIIHVISVHYIAHKCLLMSKV